MFRILFFYLFLLIPFYASAELRIDITQGNTEPIPMAILDFNSKNSEEKKLSKNINKVIKNRIFYIKNPLNLYK